MVWVPEPEYIRNGISRERIG